MKSNYKKLGEYIREVNKRNKDLQVSLLLGVSISKEFIPSIANTIGTDFSNYKIVEREQFAYGPVTSRNGNKISIALLNEDMCIISSSYMVFEIIDKSLLLPEYLMMWFRKPEFDRYARFKSEGSVREIFSWNELCNIELPIPDIERQRKIVKQYNQINKAIQIKEAINNNLEEQAVCLFRKFIPYKTESELPENWRIGTLDEIIEIHDSKRIPLSSIERNEMTNKIYPYYGAASLMDYVDDYIFDGIYLLFGEDGTVIDDFGHPILQYVWGKFWVNNHAHIITGNTFSTESIYLLCKQLSIATIVTGAVQAKISQTNLKSIEVVIPPENIIKGLNAKIEPLFNKIRKNKDLIGLLLNLRNALLPKLMLENSDSCSDKLYEPAYESKLSAEPYNSSGSFASASKNLLSEQSSSTDKLSFI